QGLALDPDTGRIWATEHGPRGGDELPVIRAGGDYAWPVVTYGITHDGRAPPPPPRAGPPPPPPPSRAPSPARPRPACHRRRHRRPGLLPRRRVPALERQAAAGHPRPPRTAPAHAGRRPGAPRLGRVPQPGPDLRAGSRTRWRHLPVHRRPRPDHPPHRRGPA